VARLLVSESDLSRLLESIADSVEKLIPYDGLVLYQADTVLRKLVPMLARHPRAQQVFQFGSVDFGVGITGFGAENREGVMSNDISRDPRVAKTHDMPGPEESLISVPLLARDELKGMLNLFRIGAGKRFEESDLELASRFAELAALAIDNAQIRMKLESEVVTDHLTGLHNHRYFQERLTEEVRRSTRSHRPVSLVLIDVDNFKRINEQDSPLEGDHVLAGLGTLLRVEARPEDVICRIGGEEFGIILPGATSEDALAMSERLRARIADTEFNGLGTKITASMGIAEGPLHATGPTELLACANYAMLQAKTAGKNRASAYVAGEWEGPRGVPKEQSRLVGQLKVLQTFASKLNRLLDVNQIGEVLMQELKTLIDYDGFRVHLLDPDEHTLRPIVFQGEGEEYEGQTEEGLTIEVGVGITGRVAETGESIYSPDAMRCEFAADVPGTPQADESVLAVPLKFGSRVIGTIGVSKLGLAQFDADDLRVMEALASHVAVAMENARLFAEERQAAETANALLRVSQVLTRRSDVDGVFDALAASSAELLGDVRVSAWIRDTTGAFRCSSQVGFGEEEIRSIFLSVVPPELGARHLPFAEEPYFMPTNVHAELIRSVGIVSDTGPTLVTPISWEPDGMAVILSTGRPDWRITQRHFRLAKGVADLASLALGNANRFADMEKAFMETVEVLANALEAKDSYTSGHAKQVAQMAVTIGAEMGMDDEEQRQLELAGVFHDIGKIGVATNIINKPGALDDAEWDEIRKHPDIGDQIMAPVEFLQPIRPLIKSSHERWDGDGYPDGLKGEEIPLGARIVAVCDAWHAMTSDRSYRKALPEKEALRRLKEASGSQFDPSSVQAFLAAHAKGLIPGYHEH
jgi:diguanylate cyclase (GGDEF)-like protein